MSKSTIAILLFAISLLHILASLSISIYYGKLAGEQVGITISTAFKMGDITHKEIQDMRNSFTAKIKPTYYLSLALSLPFGPIFKPFHDKWITKPVLSQEIGKETFKKRGIIFDSTLLLLNAIFFSLFIFYTWKLIEKIRNQELNKKSYLK